MPQGPHDEEPLRSHLVPGAPQSFRGVVFAGHPSSVTRACLTPLALRAGATPADTFNMRVSDEQWLAAARARAANGEWERPPGEVFDALAKAL